jgi:hypothetical protein
VLIWLFGLVLFSLFEKPRLLIWLECGWYAMSLKKGKGAKEGKG